MSADTDLVTSEREALKQYADWYSRQGYQVSVEPSPRELPEFLRTLTPDLIAHRDGENIALEIKTSSPASFEQVNAFDKTTRATVRLARFSRLGVVVSRIVPAIGRDFRHGIHAVAKQLPKTRRIIRPARETTADPNNRDRVF